MSPFDEVSAYDRLPDISEYDEMVCERCGNPGGYIRGMCTQCFNVVYSNPAGINNGAKPRDMLAPTQK